MPSYIAHTVTYRIMLDNLTALLNLDFGHSFLSYASLFQSVIGACHKPCHYQCATSSVL